MKKYASSVLAKGSSANNSPAIQNIIDKASTGTCLMFPDGEYYFSSALRVFDKQIHFQGSEKTTLYFREGGLKFDRTADHGKCYVNDISLISTADRKTAGNNGIEGHSVIMVKNVWIRNFSTGILMNGDIGSSKTDVSFSKFDNCLVSECGEGIHMHGGDSNQIGFYHIDIRDCDGWGVNDNSFLGCNFFACMTHANKSGGYRVGVPVDNVNSRASFFGCYGEGDQPPSEYCGYGTVFGGRCAWKKTGGNPLILPEGICINN